MRRLWRLRRGRCAGNRLLRPSCLAAPRPGGVRHRQCRGGPPRVGQGRGVGDRGLQRRQPFDAPRSYGHRPCALLDGRGRRPRERATLRLPAPYGRFRAGAQRQPRQFTRAGALLGGQGEPLPLDLRQRDPRAPHQEGAQLGAPHFRHHRRAQHARRRVRLPDHDREPALRLPRQVRPASAVDRPAQRRLGRQLGDLRAGHRGRGVRARRQSGRDRHARPQRHPQP